MTENDKLKFLKRMAISHMVVLQMHEKGFKPTSEIPNFKREFRQTEKLLAEVEQKITAV